MAAIGVRPSDRELDHGPPGLRRLEFRGTAGLSGVAAEHGCSLAAVVQLVPFFLDDDFVTVLASAAARPSNADMIVLFRSASVRKPSAEEILLAFQLGPRRHSVYMDAALLEHDEVIFCIEQPSVWIASSPDALRSELRAQIIKMPARLTRRNRTQAMPVRQG
jgi:hypothetical protein